MKKKIICMFFLVALMLPASVYAEDFSIEYIVKLKSEHIGLYSETEESPKYILTSDTQLIEELSSLNIIEYIEPNYEVELFSFPLDEKYLEQWQLSMVKTEYAWEYKTFGNYTKIGIIDSGCNKHEDITVNLLEGKNYITSSDNTDDNIGHGTHLSGIVAATMNTSGIVGIAPYSKIIPLKCFDAYESTKVSMIADAIYDAVDVYECDVINMSFGLLKDSQTLREAIQYAYDNGVIMIASVGNKGTNVNYYPASYEEVVGVGSINSSKTISDFSQFNNSVYVVAPGENVYSLSGTDDYCTMGGTSQSSAIVSGMAALICSSNNSITPYDFQQVLKETSDDLGELGYDNQYGYGLINIEQAFKKTLESSDLYISPISQNEGNCIFLISNNSENTQTISFKYTYYLNQELLTVEEQIICMSPGEYETIEISHENVDRIEICIDSGNNEVINKSFVPDKVSKPDNLIIGDLNNSGTITSIDRIILARHLSKWDGYETIDLKAGDFNEDGKISVLDRVKLSRFLSGWTE